MGNTISPLVVRSPTASTTEVLGVALGRLLRAPMCVALIGGLGAGKTTFTRGIVEGVEPGEGEFVASPTYNVCHVYRTEPPVHHYDLYRIESEDDLESVGFYDSIDAGILLIEWPENVPSTLERADICVRLEPIDMKQRTVVFESMTPHGKTVCDALRDETASLGFSRGA